LEKNKQRTLGVKIVSQICEYPKIGVEWSKCTSIEDHVFEEAYSRFREAISKTPKSHNLFILYLNNIYFSALESS
jgi:hypothetical protein